MVGKKTKVPHAPRNYQLPGGVYRFSRARMYQINAVYKKKSFKPVEKMFAPKELHKTKTVGGEKNGGTRLVPIHRDPSAYDTERERKVRKPRNKLPFSQHKRRLRSSLKPGTVVIMLAGRHKGKRAVFLKQLDSGLLLVTGPMSVNNCPMRRINQIYVIGTATQIDISGVDIPENVDDDYFRRQKRQRQCSRQTEGDIFAEAKKGYSVSDERKVDQKTVDTAVLAAIRKREDKKLMFGYLGSSWSLRRNEYPHQMKF
jgi:large subunit ribosomal protein L6e